MGEVIEANESTLDLVTVLQSAGFVVECEKCHAKTDINSVSSESLKEIAEEIETKFNQRPGVYFNAAVSDSTNKVNATDVDLEEQLLILKQSQSSWDQIFKAWDSTFNERQKLINSKGCSNLWEFTEYPCLKRDTGSELIVADFAKKFPNVTINIDGKREKDAVILQLLPLALKAADKKVRKSTPKRKKIDTPDKEN
ncbi:hypothetical protein KQX54_002683 [Cotesia glomerata]|uniref:Uncharacterized protein n=1 Tax=Cotesia glomerata TaxID=32391 RepID=A0AAV7HWL2_COTGL|nr:hypothetical protein KQX54_002683 [Cotesia glomerata]